MAFFVNMRRSINYKYDHKCRGKERFKLEETKSNSTQLLAPVFDQLGHRQDEIVQLVQSRSQQVVAGRAVGSDRSPPQPQRAEIAPNQLQPGAAADKTALFNLLPRFN